MEYVWIVSLDIIYRMGDVLRWTIYVKVGIKVMEYAQIATTVMSSKKIFVVFKRKKTNQLRKESSQ
jgi:hypothetical protein